MSFNIFCEYILCMFLGLHQEELFNMNILKPFKKFIIYTSGKLNVYVIGMNLVS